MFVARAEKELDDFSTPAQQAAWINATYITDDTDAIAARFGAEGTEMQVRFALEAAKYASVPGLSFDTRRKIDLLRSGLTLPAPTTPGAAGELATIVTRMSSRYGKPCEAGNTYISGSCYLCGVVFFLSRTATRTFTTKTITEIAIRSSFVNDPQLSLQQKWQEQPHSG